MSAMASQKTRLTIVYSTVYSNADQKLRTTVLCAGNAPGTRKFPAQMASKAENVSIWLRHHEIFLLIYGGSNNYMGNKIPNHNNNNNDDNDNKK